MPLHVRGQGSRTSFPLKRRRGLLRILHPKDRSFGSHRTVRAVPVGEGRGDRNEIGGSTPKLPNLWNVLFE
jgi:hypothetical protein